ncbi:ATP-dependent RNA helicase RhlE [Mucilaginibacter frigoritolerans]|jgi:superfamily II DNA/RNA helicase|uniref:ATP-dependent RNA helicase RhlE n=1 Tax=Mucilaginibacter frigoritolerans TaxID=652788 RepID=A0A562TV65_9SPHI|nr:DEAD/DEAH box helicase [Mucilaginibacter frigoritolerans]TWI96690.1 ATP-dependent RNA helicase RhlE [Mucilaginibacter frigoritolerans]
MAWSEKLKLNKQLIKSVTEAGYMSPKEVQQKSLSRIFGGQDIIAVGHEGCGKTTTYVLAVLNRLKYNTEGVPNVLILVPEKDDVLAVIERFELLNRNKSLSIVGLYAAPGIESQMNALADGADVVVATPDRARAIYLKLGLNLNKVDLLIIDDAEKIVKQGLQLPVVELANSIDKCQHLVFSEVLHSRLEKMIEPFMNLPAIIEIDETGETIIETFPQVLYIVPNFGTKLNLLNLFMQDDELFTKTVIFVNTRQTAEKVYRSLQNRHKKNVALLNSTSIEINGLDSTDDFKTSPSVKILIIANDTTQEINLDGIPFILHFELPEEKETYIFRVAAGNISEEDETLAITFATDLELSMVKKIELAIGQKIPLGDIPEGVIIEKDKKDAELEAKKSKKSKDSEPVVGAAFHEKKASNVKNYNYSSGQKAKMNKKKKHS